MEMVLDKDPFLCVLCTHEGRIGPSPQMAISVQGILKGSIARHKEFGH